MPKGRPAVDGGPRPGLLRTASFRLALAHSALFGLSVLVLLVFIYLTTAGLLERQVDQTLDAELSGLAGQYRDRGLAGLKTAIDLRSRQSGSGIYLLTDRAGTALAGNLDRWPAAASAAADGPYIDFRVDHLRASEGSETTSIPARARTFALTGGYRLLVGYDLSERQRFRAMITRTLIWALGITALLGLAEGWVLSRLTLRRVEAISRFSRGVVTGDLQHRLPVSGRGDEFDRLSDQVNAMLDRIARLMSGMREVTDNVAHDLRRPLTRLKSRLELLQLRDQSVADYRHAIAETIAETDGILQTFDALMSIARAEAGSAADSFETVDLAAVVASVAELYDPLAAERGIALVTQVTPDLRIRGHRQLLAQALTNLTDNAIKYSPDGGRVEIAGRIAGGRIVLSVADHGPGIPPADRDRVLDRFVRLESSRSTIGNGLGLSLVAAIATLHGATLTLDDNAPGLRVTLSFNVADANSS
ncbi:MAG: ATP-binding protein [Inquilinaceae bacterium]